MTNETESAEIVRTILLLAKNLKLDVVAEGIETELQHEILKDLKCEYGQGYYFSRPLIVSDAKEFIENSTFKYTFVPVNNLENQSSFIEH
jgi:EAL domain-containing protein (putative c-di-GMP-specific phosphodiesterase class I)